MHNVKETTTRSGNIIEDHPAIHVMRGQLSDNAFKSTYEYVATLNEENASLYPDDRSRGSLDNMKGDQVTVDWHHPSMQLYVNEIRTAVIEYFEHCVDPLNPKFRQQTNRYVDICACWCLKMQRGDYVQPHTHRSEAKSGVTTVSYLKLPAGLIDPDNPYRPENHNRQQYSSVGGGLALSWPSNNANVFEDDLTPANARHIYPELGAFWVFPKFLSHMVFPYRGGDTDEQTRLALSSNWNLFLPEKWK